MIDVKRNSNAVRKLVQKLMRSHLIHMGLAPLLLYFVLFTLLTYPSILHFSTHLFVDGYDGVQGYWNIWWVEKAVTELHQLPWETTYLHYPHGVTLIPHALHASNGFIAIPFLQFLSLIQTFNLIIIFTFVIGGLTAFLLAFHFTKSYWSSLIGGFVFGFSNYHFAHATGHVQVTTLQWLPLFALAWYILLTKPRVRAALLAAFVLLVITMTDYYYLVYSVLLAVIFAIWCAIRRRDALFLIRKEYRLPILTFVVVTLLTSGSLAFSLLWINARDPLVGAHAAAEFSLDLLAPIIPGGHWRFSELTRGYWSDLPGNIEESSVHMGVGVILLLVFVWLKRRTITTMPLLPWYAVLVFFTVMSLGPILHIWGNEIAVRMPYTFLENVLPFLKLSGVPVRMMVMTMLATSVIVAAGFKILFQGSTKTRIVATMLLGLIVVEYLPSPLSLTRIVTPGYVAFLRDLPGTEGVMDAVTNGEPPDLYYQTIHEKPMTFGYVARVPQSVETKDADQQWTLYGDQYQELCRRFAIRYLVLPATRSGPQFPAIFRDEHARVYDLSRYGSCST